MEQNQTVQAILITSFFVMGFGIVGTMDYNDALAEERHYCASVERYKFTNGLEGHPDYKSLREICGGMNGIEEADTRNVRGSN
jgi:hypothetical protein